MRTTLAIDDDVLAAAKGLAVQQGRTIGEVVSGLARQALTPYARPVAVRNGVVLLPVQPHAEPVTPDLIKALMDDLP